MTAAVDFIFRLPQGLPDDMLVTRCPNCQHHFPCEQQEAEPMLVSLTLPAASKCTFRIQVGSSTILQRGLTGGQLTVKCPSPSPEPSPSDPIAFVIPPSCALTFLTPNNLSERPNANAAAIAATKCALRTSGWYYEGLSWQESASLLMPTAPGTFLVRDSSDPRFNFSLSVQTERGPTSVRLHCQNGYFRLDAAPKLVPEMPVFECVVRLVEHYVDVTSNRSHDRSGKEQVWIDCSGKTYSSILLTRPLYQRSRFPSLQHLARLALSRFTDIPATELPQTLRAYLAEYPYSQ